MNFKEIPRPICCQLPMVVIGKTVKGLRVFRCRACGAREREGVREAVKATPMRLLVDAVRPTCCGSPMIVYSTKKNYRIWECKTCGNKQSDKRAEATDVSGVLRGVPPVPENLRRIAARRKNARDGAGRHIAELDRAGEDDLKPIGKWGTWAEAWRKVDAGYGADELIRAWEWCEEVERALRGWR